MHRAHVCEAGSTLAKFEKKEMSSGRPRAIFAGIAFTQDVVEEERREKIGRVKIYSSEIRSAASSRHFFYDLWKWSEEILSPAALEPATLRGVYGCNGDRPFVLFVAGCVNNDRRTA